ncbi:MAG: DUF3857 domain-containing protein [Opitutaceae bacterium]|nr:DUF3857 domain-containing protein [Opitutaceae bacterium]
MPGLLLHLLLGVALALSGATLLQAQPAAPVATGEPPAWVRPRTLAAPAAWRAHASGRRYLLVDRQSNLSTRETYCHHAFQVVSEEGLRSGSQVAIDYDPSYETLVVHHLRVVREGRATDHLDPGKFQLLRQERDLDRQLYNGELSALRILEDVRVGDVIDLAFTLRGWNPVFGDHFSGTLPLTWTFPVADQSYRMLLPPDRSLRHKVHGAAAPEFAARPLDGGTELTWTMRDVPAVEFDTNSPKWHTPFSYLQLTDYASWAEVTAWAQPLYATGAPLPAAMHATVERLRAAGATPEARIIAALRFVQSEVRYLGIELGPGSHRPSEPAVVHERRFGDCKDKSLLFCALLRELGVEAGPVFVSSWRGHTLHDWLPSPGAFDHVVALVTLAGRSHLVDPTLNYQRATLLRQAHTGAYATGLPVAGTALVDFSPGEYDRGQLAVEETFSVPGIDQPATLVVVTSFHGRMADQTRSYFENTPREQIAKNYLNYYARTYPEISLQAPVEYLDFDQGNSVRVTERYQLARFFTRPAGGSAAQVELYAGVIADYMRYQDILGRRSPLGLNHPVDVRQRTTIQLPETWSITPESQTIDDEAFTFTHESSLRGKSIRLDYHWLTKQDHVAVARLPAFQTKQRAAMEALGYRLTHDAPSDPGAAARLSWPAILLAGLLALGGLACLLVVLLRPAAPAAPPLLAADPYSRPARRAAEGLGGWLALLGAGVCLRPIGHLLALHEGRQMYFSTAAWAAVNESAGGDQYADLLMAELMSNVGMLFYGLVLVVMFFRRLRAFPRSLIIYLVFAVLLGGFELWIAGQYPGALPEETGKQAGRLLGTLLGAAIWIPYLVLSQRVQRTFVR